MAGAGVLEAAAGRGLVQVEVELLGDSISACGSFDLQNAWKDHACRESDVGNEGVVFVVELHASGVGAVTAD